MKTNTFFTISILALVSFSSCVSNDTANSDSVKQSEIYQSYTFTYNASDMEMSATAYFRFGGSSGTTLLLSKPSSITLDGVEMAMGKSAFTGSYYELNQQTPFKGIYQFVFTDTEKKEYKNKLMIGNLAIINTDATISRKKGMTIKFEGLPVANGEKVILTIQDVNHGTRTVSTDIEKTSTITLKPEDLKDFPLGDANIFLTREQNSKLFQATHLGGNMNASYISKKVGIKVVE